uniref:HemK methyltransferase family member 1 n=1 Tax=Rhizophora mucronata TaxID=61149 RepID=A0A2P2MY75_RHIMU
MLPLPTHLLYHFVTIFNGDVSPYSIISKAPHLLGYFIGP